MQKTTHGDGPAYDCYFDWPSYNDWAITWLNCPAGYQSDGENCFEQAPKNNGCQTDCDREGNPITPSNGNKFETAVDYFTKTIEINAEYTEAYYNRGFAYELLKDAPNARKDYQKTLELFPNYELAIDGMNRVEEFLEAQRN